MEEEMTMPDFSLEVPAIAEQPAIADFIAQFDLLFIAIFLAAAILYFYTIGKDHVMTAIIAAYIAFVIFTTIPYLKELPIDIGQPDYIIHLGIFAALIAMISWILLKNPYFEPYTVPDGMHLAIFSIAFVGLVVSLGMTILPEEVILELSEWTKLVFLSQPWASVFMAVPAILALIVKGD